MGKGDRKTKKGKIWKGSYGIKRKRNRKSQKTSRSEFDSKR